MDVGGKKGEETNAQINKSSAKSTMAE